MARKLLSSNSNQSTAVGFISRNNRKLKVGEHVNPLSCITRAFPMTPRLTRGTVCKCPSSTPASSHLPSIP